MSGEAGNRTLQQRAYRMPFSPYRREPHGGRRFKYEKNKHYCQCKSNKCVINNQAICVKLCKILSIEKIAHFIIRVQKQNCTPLTKCAKITIDVIKLHMYLQVCKNKIAHITCSVQKFGVFMNFANNTLQMMK